MTLKTNWSIDSGDENSRNDFLSDFDLKSSSSRTLNKLNIERRMFTPLSVFKERNLSTNQYNINSIAEINKNYTSDSYVLSKTRYFPSPYDDSSNDPITTLTDRFQACTIDENKNNSYSSNTTDCRSNLNTNNPFSFNRSSMFNASSLFSESSFFSTKPTFDQREPQTWSNLDFSFEKYNSLGTNVLNSPNMTSFSDQSPLLSSTPLRKESSFSIKKLQTTNDHLSSDMKISFVHRPSSTIVFTSIIFIIGLLLGYLLTTAISPYFVYYWFCIISEICIQISINYFAILLSNVQIFIKYISSFLPYQVI